MQERALQVQSMLVTYPFRTPWPASAIDFVPWNLEVEQGDRQHPLSLGSWQIRFWYSHQLQSARSLRWIWLPLGTENLEQVLQAVAPRISDAWEHRQVLLTS